MEDETPLCSKATTELLRLSLSVGNTDEISNFICDFRKIVDFIKHHSWLVD